MSGVRAGQLSRRVQIQQRSNAQDSFGQPQLLWTDIAAVWADIEPLTGRELESAQRVCSEVSHQITVRYQAIFSSPGEVASYRGLYKGRIFNIQACLNQDERNAVITLLASEGLNEG